MAGLSDGEIVSIGSAVRRTVRLGDATSAADGIGVRNFLAADRSSRPGPDFLFGPASPESLRHFHEAEYLPPASIHTLHDVEVVGPWFITGTLLVRGEVDFHFDGIALNPDNEESRRRLEEHQGKTARLEKTIRRVPGRTVLLANNGHQIYGHWLVDFLPKLHLLDLAGLDLGQLNVLLPTNMGKFGGEFLRLLGIPDDRLIRYDPDTETIVAEELLVPSTLRWGGRCSPLFTGAIDFLNQRIDQVNRVPPSPVRRMFLSRRRSGRDGRQLLDEDRLEAVAVAAGLTLVHPEELPLLEQIALFRGVDHVIGQYGSGLHATIFSRPGTVVCGLHGQLPATFDALQSGIGERLGQPTGYVFGASVPELDPWAMRVDEADFTACLEAQFAA